MIMRNLPTFGNKRKRSVSGQEDGSEYDKITDADLTVSKTIESLAKKEGKKHGYKNGKA